MAGLWGWIKLARQLSADLWSDWHGLKSCRRWISFIIKAYYQSLTVPHFSDLRFSQRMLKMDGCVLHHQCSSLWSWYHFWYFSIYSQSSQVMIFISIVWCPVIVCCGYRRSSALVFPLLTSFFYPYLKWPAMNNRHN